MHKYLTPAVGKLFLVAGLLSAISIAQGQAQDSGPADDAPLDLSHYQGPGMVSPGVGNIGEGSGRVNSFAIFGSVNGLYDSFLQTSQTDSKGNLVSNTGALSMEAGGGITGTRLAKRGKLGVDYRGSVRYYPSSDGLNGSDQTAKFGYTLQATRRLILDFKALGGTYVYGVSGPGSLLTSDASSGLGASAQLFDSRVNYLRGLTSATVKRGARMFITFGGGANLFAPTGAGLNRTHGYDANASVTRRMSRNSNIGMSYQYSRMEFPSTSGRSNVHAIQGSYSTLFDRFWRFSIDAGASIVDIQNNVTIVVNPALVPFFGPTLTFRNVNKSIYPSGTISLTRSFKTSAVSISYLRGITSGNGLFTTSRQEAFNAQSSYSGFRRVGLGADVSYGKLIALSQSVGGYGTYSVGGFGSYALGRGVRLRARYDFRHQTVDTNSYLRNGSRVLFGVEYVKNEVPLPVY